MSLTNPAYRMKPLSCLPAVPRLFLPLVAVVALASFDAIGATYATPRALAVGDIYELRRDGWSDPPGGPAYNGDVLPKIDLHSGSNGDVLYFRRHNVARAWPTDVGYWYTGPDQFEGEPDPAGEQWVDYVPPFEILGPGRYAISAGYRWGSTRASYPAVYTVHHALGTNDVLRDQRTGSATATITYFSLGEFEMRPGSFVRVTDTGTESITFSQMRFRLVTPEPRLQVVIEAGNCRLSWPTNAAHYRLETALEPSGAVWEPVFELPLQAADRVTVTVPTGDSPRFFRLITP